MGISKSVAGALLVIGLVVAGFARCEAQTKEFVRKSSSYYWGEAVAESEREASDKALARLTESIAVRVSSSFEKKQVEQNGALQETVRDILKTYSTATLRNVKTLRSTVQTGIEVFHYIEKQEVRQIFDARIKMVQGLYDRARELEQSVDIGNALKEYYFAIVLMNSVPDQQIPYLGKDLVAEIPERINQILLDTRFALKADRRISDTERELVFSIHTGEKPVRYLEYAAWDGTGQVNVQALDGEAILRLYGASTAFTKLDAKVKYSFYESREEIREVADLWDLVPHPTFKNSRTIPLTVTAVETPLAASKRNTLAAHAVAVASMGNVRLAKTDSCAVAESILRGTSAFVGLLKAKSETAVLKSYGSDPFLSGKLAAMLKYNRPVPVDDTVDVSLNRTSTGWEARRIRVMTTYPSLSKQSLEYLVLDFTPEGRLEDVNFGIMDDLYQDFVEQGKLGKDWSNRQVIVKFAEKYRTAYLSRNVAMLDSLFADDAVIIIGKVLQRSPKQSSDAFPYLRASNAQPDYTTIRYTKEQYLKNQKKTFEQQKDLYVGYSTFGISRKNKADSVYGLSMRQAYASSSYADEGYLFLLVDFSGSTPQIYVRSWQPQEWNNDALIRLSNFNINR